MSARPRQDYRADSADGAAASGRCVGVLSDIPYAGTGELARSGCAEQCANEKDNFAIEPYRWTVEMPAWQRYGKGGEFPYVTSRWWDPFNHQSARGRHADLRATMVFSILPGRASLRRMYADCYPPSNVAAEEPGSKNFFGRGEEAFVDQSFRLSFDLFHWRRIVSARGFPRAVHTGDWT